MRLICNTRILIAGMALLFSAGTFLFVATHVMAEMDSPSPSGDHESNHPQSNGKKVRITYFLLGMLAPLVLSALLGHHHGH